MTRINCKRFHLTLEHIFSNKVGILSNKAYKHKVYNIVYVGFDYGVNLIDQQTRAPLYEFLSNSVGMDDLLVPCQ